MNGSYEIHGITIGRNGAEIAKDACARCGHAKADHVYEAGPCRPGWECLARCEHYAYPDFIAADLARGLTSGDPRL